VVRQRWRKMRATGCVVITISRVAGLHAVSIAADRDLSASQLWPRLWPQDHERVGSRNVIALLSVIRQLVYSPCQNSSAGTFCFDTIARASRRVVTQQRAPPGQTKQAD
jgi:hypothetical protein